MIIDLNTAVSLIQAGEMIAYPTEAVYGLGCDPANQTAVNAVFNYKKRNTSKQFILIASDFRQLENYIGKFTDLSLAFQHKITEKSPGFHTWVISAIPSCPEWLLGETGKIAVRISTHPVVKALCDQVGALISTSANLSGQPSATSIAVLNMYFGESLPILAGDLGQEARPSPIQDLYSGEYLRQ